MRCGVCVRRKRQDEEQDGPGNSERDEAALAPAIAVAEGALGVGGFVRIG